MCLFSMLARRPRRVVEHLAALDVVAKGAAGGTVALVLPTAPSRSCSCSAPMTAWRRQRHEARFAERLAARRSRSARCSASPTLSKPRRAGGARGRSRRRALAAREHLAVRIDGFERNPALRQHAVPSLLVVAMEYLYHEYDAHRDGTHMRGGAHVAGHDQFSE